MRILYVILTAFSFRFALGYRKETRLGSDRPNRLWTIIDIDGAARLSSIITQSLQREVLSPFGT